MLKINSVDMEIIKALLKNSRIPYTRLAEKTGFSRVRVKKRIEELQKKGVIEKFTIQVQSQFLNKPLPVFFNVVIQPKFLEDTAIKISSHPNISIVYQVSGADALHIHGFFHNMEEVAYFINHFLSEFDGIVNVSTDFLLKRYKSNPGVKV